MMDGLPSRRERLHRDDRRGRGRKKGRKKSSQNHLLVFSDERAAIGPLEIP
jgi:hypothetical protein